MPFIEASAKNAINVEDTFMTISKEIYNRYQVTQMDTISGVQVLNKVEDLKDKYMSEQKMLSKERINSFELRLY